MEHPSIPPSAIVALRNLVRSDVLPPIDAAQMLAAAGLITQEPLGPVRATDLGMQLAETAPE